MINIKNQKKDIIYITLLVVIFTVSFLVMGKVYGDLFMDCGREAMLPELMTQGEVLFKDIFGMYNPLSYEVNALAYIIFHPSFNLLYALTFINSLAVIIGLYVLSRFFVNEIFSFSMTMLTASLYIVGTTSILSYLFPYSFGFLYAVVWLLYGTICGLKYIKTNEQKYLYWGMLMVGISFANKPDFLACVIPFIWLLVTGEKKNVLKGIGLFLIPVAVSYGILFVQGLTVTDFLNYIEFNKNFFSTHEQMYYTVNVLSPLWTKERFYIVLHTFGNLLIFMAVSVFYFSLYGKNKYFKVGALSLIPMYVQYCYGYLGENKFYNLFSWAFVVIGVYIYFNYDKLKTKDNKMLMFLGLTGILSEARINFSAMYVYDYGIYCLLPVIFVMCLIFRVNITKISKYKKYLAASMIALSLMNIYYVKKHTFDREEVVTSKGTIYAPSGESSVFNNLVRWVEKNTKSGESVLMLPESIMLNYVTERPTKPKYYHLIPNHISALGEESIVRGLESDKPDYIIINSMEYRMYGNTSMCKDFGEKICKFTEDNYKKVYKTSSRMNDGQVFEAAVYKLGIKTDDKLPKLQ